jgi:hypothetical protein
MNIRVEGDHRKYRSAGKKVCRPQDEEKERTLNNDNILELTALDLQEKPATH